MNRSKTQQTRQTFRMLTLVGGLLMITGIVLRLLGLLIMATFAIGLTGAVLLLVGIIGLLIIQTIKPK